ncbi:MAG: acyltransferase family protein [Massilia sp.]
MATTPQSPQTVPAARTDKLLTIEAARGIAALLVAFFHGSHVVELAQPGRGAPFGGFFSFGHAGVPFFFVLSGYIIYYIHHADLDRPGRLGSFAWKRATRIYPLFLVVMVLVTAKTWFAGAFEWDYWLKSVLLLPQSRLPLLVQSWTLVHEVLFYALFGLAIWRVRVSRWALLAWAVLFCTARVVDLQLPAGLFGDTVKTLASPYNLLFLLGMGVAWVLRHRTIAFPRMLALAGALAFLAAGLVEDTGLYKSMAEHGLLPVLLYGVSSACIIIGLVAAETAAKPAGSLRIGRIGGLLGALSYPLYLTHGIAISIAVEAARKLHYDGSGALLLTGAVAVACVAAMVVHRCVEKPVAKWLRNVWARRRAAPAFT